MRGKIFQIVVLFISGLLVVKLFDLQIIKSSSSDFLDRASIQKVYDFADAEINSSKDIGKEKYLFNYSKKHYLDATLLILVTDKLNLFFSNSNFLLKNFRRSGIALFSRSNLARNVFKNYATRGSLLSIKND